MDWLLCALTAGALLVMFAPILTLAVTVFVLAPLAALTRHPTMISRTAFDCPISKRRATVEFLTPPEAGRPSDVLACSVFPDGRVRCEKACRDLAATAWTRSPAVARYALIAGDTAYR